jgi:hypothetical protein
MKQYIPIVFVIMLFIGGCAGTDLNDTDTTPPARLTLIPHLGDTGDLGIRLDTLNYYKEPFNDFEYLQNGEEYNGIDAVSDDDNIQIQISSLELDITDIDFLELYRFSLENYYSNPDNNADLVKTQNFPGNFLVTDNFTDGIPPIGFNWFYFVKSYDSAGNYSVSDTVCYKILDKPVLDYPLEGTSFDNLLNVSFDWNFDDSSEIVRNRILLFDFEYNLLWSYEPTDLEERPIIYSGFNYGNGFYIWRVEGFGQTPDISNPTIINDEPYIIYSGTESYERTFSVN